MGQWDLWDSSIEGVHSSVTARKSKGEGSDLGQTQGCAPVVPSSITLAVGQDGKQDSQPVPRQGHQTAAAAGGD